MAKNVLTELDAMKAGISEKGGKTSRAQHARYCKELTDGMTPRSSGPNLARVFHSSLLTNQRERGPIHQPFLEEQHIREREKLNSACVGSYRTAWLLFGDDLSGKRVRVAGGPQGYEFRCVNREIPPLRQKRAGVSNSGRGGIDYLAVATSSASSADYPLGMPVLGEIKSRSKKGESGFDKNVFYAFIQSLWYLSRMGTQHQVDRAAEFSDTRVGGFGLQVSHPQKFDLHILLADLHLLPKSTRNAHRKLIDSTFDLAQTFRRRLPKHSGAVVGRILCLQMDSEVFEHSTEPTVHCNWWV